VKLLAFIFVTISFYSCATTNSKAKLVLKRASFDLNCKHEYLEILDLGGNNYGAIGCGKKGAYVVSCKDWGDCTAILNSKVQ